LPWQPLPRTILPTTLLERVHTTVKGNTEGLPTLVPLTAVTWNHLYFSMKWWGNTCITSVQISLIKTSSQLFTFSREWLYDLSLAYILKNWVALLLWSFWAGTLYSAGTFQCVGGIWREACRPQHSVWQSCPPVCRAWGHALFLSLKWWGVTCIIAYKCFFVNWVSNTSFTWTKKCGCSPFQGQECVTSFFPYIKSCWVIWLLCKL